MQNDGNSTHCERIKHYQPCLADFGHGTSHLVSHLRSRPANWRELGELDLLAPNTMSKKTSSMIKHTCLDSLCQVDMYLDIEIANSVD